MRSKILKLAFCVILANGITGTKAQEVLLSTGGNSSGSGGSISYSIGQFTYTTNTATTGSVAQGVQQAFEISVITALKETKLISLDCSVYPNPTSDYLILKIEGELQPNYVAYLYDINAKLIKSIRLENSETRIEMIQLVPAIYFLKVLDNDRVLKVFKIIKY